MERFVTKRNGDIVKFDRSKIESAICKSMEETEKGVDLQIVNDVSRDVETIVYCGMYTFIPSVESIQDEVERVLAEYDRFDASKKYILYRDKRTKLRENGWEMTDLQRDIYEKKYKLSNEDFDGFLERVSGGNQFIKKAIRDKKFLPAGRVLAGRGIDKKVTLSNCYVMPKVSDTIESIFDSAKYLAKTYSHGGGSGLNISNLRPNGSKVQNSAQTTTGAVSFMELYSMVTGLIGQRGRRGALMLNMDISHPDIEEFMDIKNSDNESVRYANISVNIWDDFMESVVRNEDYLLEFKVDATGEIITKVVNARDLFRKLAENNWNRAEPGVLFQDRINSWHLMSEDETFEFAGVNPCGEEPLPAFGSCNLASINLAEFVRHPYTDKAYFDFDSFDKMVMEGVIYLNEILDENMDNHPLEQQKEVSRDLRQIGLGIMGLADMFIKLGIKYGSVESLDMSNKIGSHMINFALRQSALLAKEHGTFPRYNRDAVLESDFLNHNAWDSTLEMIEKYGLRNSQLLTIAPTGSISTMIGVSGGIEPIFQLSYTRKSETLHDSDMYYKVHTPIVQEYMRFKGITDERDLPDFFVTSSDIDYRDRINVQSSWQYSIDASISSTVNLPEDTSVETVENLYKYAWSNDLKGITVYRDGCSRGGILITDTKKDRSSELEELQSKMDELVLESLTENPNICPFCGGDMIHSGGCTECTSCGYSPCSI